jgi:hypothetical protein
MPRVYNIGKSVDAFCEKTGNGSSSWDLCQDCAHDLKNDPHIFDAELIPYNGDPNGEDGREGDMEHPSYSECDYKCEVCKQPLTEDDD